MDGTVQKMLQRLAGTRLRDGGVARGRGCREVRAGAPRGAGGGRAFAGRLSFPSPDAHGRPSDPSHVAANRMHFYICFSFLSGPSSPLLGAHGRPPCHVWRCSCHLTFVLPYLITIPTMLWKPVPVGQGRVALFPALPLAPRRLSGTR